MGEDPSTEKMAAPSEPSAEEQVALIFDTIDIDDDQTITKAEYNRALTGRKKTKIRKMMTDAGLDWKEVFMGISEHSDRYGNLSREAFGRVCGVSSSAAAGEAEDQEDYKNGNINPETSISEHSIPETWEHPLSQQDLEIKKSSYMNDFLAPRVYEVRAPQPGPSQPGQRRSRFD